MYVGLRSWPASTVLISLLRESIMQSMFQTSGVTSMHFKCLLICYKRNVQCAHTVDHISTHRVTVPVSCLLGCVLIGFKTNAIKLKSMPMLWTLMIFINYNN